MTATQTTPTFYRVLSWIITLSVPVALVLTSVRLLLLPAFLKIEYNMPNFPEDFYGFTKEDRLHWSRFAVDYLLNSADISYLGDLKFEDGSPVYNERELRHMLDVKNTVQAALMTWYVTLGLILLMGLWAWFGKWWSAYRTGMARGGLLTILLVGTLIFFVIISFGVLFVAFHNIFFQAGTWMFEYSDTLIRLFPERLWRDVFTIVGLLSLAGGLGIYFGFRPRKNVK